MSAAALIPWMMNVVTLLMALAPAHDALAAPGTDGETEDSIAGRTVIVRYDARRRTGSVHDAANGEELPSVIAYWFASYAFYPDTAVYEAGREAPREP